MARHAAPPRPLSSGRRATPQAVQRASSNGTHHAVYAIIFHPHHQTGFARRSSNHAKFAVRRHLSRWPPHTNSFLFSGTDPAGPISTSIP